MAEKAKKALYMLYKQKRNQLIILSLIMMIVIGFIILMFVEGNLLMVVVGIVAEILLVLLFNWINKKPLRLDNL